MRTRIGRISHFDRASWWGQVEFSDSTSLDFHATCYTGASMQTLPLVGDLAEVIFSDACMQRVTSVTLCLE